VLRKHLGLNHRKTIQVGHQSAHAKHQSGPVARFVAPSGIRSRPPGLHFGEGPLPRGSQKRIGGRRKTALTNKVVPPYLAVIGGAV